MFMYGCSAVCEISPWWPNKIIFTALMWNISVFFFSNVQWRVELKLCSSESELSWLSVDLVPNRCLRAKMGYMATPYQNCFFSMNIVGFILQNIILKKICWYLNQNSRYGPITKWFNWLTKDFQQQNRLSGILHNSFNNAYKNKQLYITRQHQYKAESYQFYCSYMHTMDIHYTG